MYITCVLCFLALFSHQRREEIREQIHRHLDLMSDIDNFDADSVEPGTISVLLVGSSSNFKKHFFALRISRCTGSLQRTVNSAKPASQIVSID